MAAYLIFAFPYLLVALLVEGIKFYHFYSKTDLLICYIKLIGTISIIHYRQVKSISNKLHLIFYFLKFLFTFKFFFTLSSKSFKSL